MDKNKATATATAFETYAALLTACKGGYIPTLKHGASDDLPTRRAKDVLASALEGDGRKVWA